MHEGSRYFLFLLQAIFLLSSPPPYLALHLPQALWHKQCYNNVKDFPNYFHHNSGNMFTFLR